MKEETYRTTAAVEDRHWWFCARRDILAVMLKRFVGKQPGKVLDIGCGTGGNFPFLSRFGEVTGIDYHADAIAACRARGFSNVLQADATQLPFADASFDIVCSLDVLNGIEDDANAVREALRVTQPDGLLLFTVAAQPWLWGATDTLSQHCRRYSCARLLALFPGEHCKVLLCSYFNTILFPLVALSRLWEYFMGRSAERVPALSTPFSSFLNRFLCTLFASERHFLTRYPLPFGVSLMVVVRKSERHDGERIDSLRNRFVR